MSQNSCIEPDIIFTDDGGELSFHTILHGIHAATILADAEAHWLAEHLAEAIWEALATERLPAHTSITAAVKTVRTMLDGIGYGELAPHFCIAAPVQHLSLVGCIAEAPLKDEDDLQARIRVSIRRLHLPGVRTLYLTGLPACEQALEAHEMLFPISKRPSLRARIVSLIRDELQLLTWRHPFRCYLG